MDAAVDGIPPIIWEPDRTMSTKMDELRIRINEKYNVDLRKNENLFNFEFSLVNRCSGIWHKPKMSLFEVFRYEVQYHNASLRSI